MVESPDAVTLWLNILLTRPSFLGDNSTHAGLLCRMICNLIHSKYPHTLLWKYKYTQKTQHIPEFWLNKVEKAAGGGGGECILPVMRRKRCLWPFQRKYFQDQLLLFLQGLKSSTIYQILSEIIKKIKSVPTLTALCAYKHTTCLCRLWVEIVIYILEVILRFLCFQHCSPTDLINNSAFCC